MDARLVMARHEAELAAEGTLQMLVTLLYADRLDEAPVVHAELRGLLGDPNRADRADRPERPAEG